MNEAKAGLFMLPESASMLEVDSLVREEQQDIEVTRTITRISEISEHTYMAYADEPISGARDTLSAAYSVYRIH